MVWVIDSAFRIIHVIVIYYFKLVRVHNFSIKYFFSPNQYYRWGLPHAPALHNHEKCTWCKLTRPKIELETKRGNIVPGCHVTLLSLQMELWKLNFPRSLLHEKWDKAYEVLSLSTLLNYVKILGWIILWYEFFVRQPNR